MPPQQERRRTLNAASLAAIMPPIEWPTMWQHVQPILAITASASRAMMAVEYCALSAGHELRWEKKNRRGKGRYVQNLLEILFGQGRHPSIRTCGRCPGCPARIIK